jgi:hypothetical protein
MSGWVVLSGIGWVVAGVSEGAGGLVDEGAMSCEEGVETVSVPNVFA